MFWNPKKRIVVDLDHPRKEVIERAAKVLKSGGVIVFPTFSLYGLGVDAFNAQAVQKVFDIKQRPLDKPLMVLVETVEDMGQLVEHIPEGANQLMNRFWPGGVTFIFTARTSVPDILTGGSGKIGIRIPSHSVAKALCKEMKGPITATSANISGRPGYHRIDQADPRLLKQADLILDAGPLAGGVGSTVVDVTVNPPVILREGRVPAGSILKLLKR